LALLSHWLNVKLKSLREKKVTRVARKYVEISGDFVNIKDKRDMLYQ